MQINRRLFVLICFFLILIASVAVATQGDEEALTTEFLTNADQLETRRNGWGESAYYDDTFYVIGGTSVYSWKPGESKLTLRYTVPELPQRSSENAEFTAEDIAALNDVANGLVPIYGEMCTFNLFSGRIGKLTEQGISWIDNLRLDVSLLDGYEGLWHPFESDGKLYAHYDMAWKDVAHKESEMVILEFDLQSGNCRVLETNHADYFGQYKPGYIILLHGGASSSPTLSVMSLSDGEINELPLEIPEQAKATNPQDKQNRRIMYEDALIPPIGGLAYDLSSDSIFFSAQSKVWRSKGGEPFEPVASLPTENIMEGAQAWVLSDGRYGIRNGAFYVREPLMGR